MTLPSQSPRINPPASSGARSAQSMRSLFVAVAAIGLGGAAAGWFLTHKSEAPESTEQTASTEPVADPLSTDAANGAATPVVVNYDPATGNAATTGTTVPAGTVVTNPTTPLGTATTTPVATANNAVANAATAGIAGTPGTAPTTPAAGIGNATQRIQ